MISSKVVTTFIRLNNLTSNQWIKVGELYLTRTEHELGTILNATYMDKVIRLCSDDMLLKLINKKRIFSPPNIRYVLCNKDINTTKLLIKNIKKLEKYTSSFNFKQFCWEEILYGDKILKDKKIELLNLFKEYGLLDRMDYQFIMYKLTGTYEFKNGQKFTGEI